MESTVELWTGVFCVCIAVPWLAMHADRGQPIGGDDLRQVLRHAPVESVGPVECTPSQTVVIQSRIDDQ